jgi:hypothetical protein
MTDTLQFDVPARPREILKVAFECDDATYNRIWLRCCRDPAVKEFSAASDLLRTIRVTTGDQGASRFDLLRDAKNLARRAQEELVPAIEAVIAIANEELGLAPKPADVSAS